MNRRLYRELWSSRFKKMLALERQAAEGYEKLLTECRKKYKGHPIQPHFEQLIADEKKHADLVEELIKILHRQPE